MKRTNTADGNEPVSFVSRWQTIVTNECDGYGLPTSDSVTARAARSAVNLCRLLGVIGNILNWKSRQMGSAFLPPFRLNGSQNAGWMGGEGPVSPPSIALMEANGWTLPSRPAARSSSNLLLASAGHSPTMKVAIRLFTWSLCRMYLFDHFCSNGLATPWWCFSVAADRENKWTLHWIFRPDYSALVILDERTRGPGYCPAIVSVNKSFLFPLPLLMMDIIGLQATAKDDWQVHISSSQFIERFKSIGEASLNPFHERHFCYQFNQFPECVAIQVLLLLGTYWPMV